LGVNDPSIFVKKAVPAEIISTQIVHNSFEDFTDLVGPLKKLIEGKGYTIPTPIQDQTIQPILDGRDVVGLASTGTGKTAAFLIPIVNRIFRFRDKKALVVVPTRELAHQIRDELFALTESLKIYSALVIGGANINRQIRDIQRNPHIVIGTPGRLKDLIEQKVLFLEDFSIFVLDEVDLMVDIGFINDIKFIISNLPRERQSLFFSATVPHEVNTIIQSFLKNPVTVSVKVKETAHGIDQDVIHIKDKKADLHLLTAGSGPY